jgi:hypothetical protein
MVRALKSVILFLTIALCVYRQSNSSNGFIPISDQDKHGFENSYSLSQSDSPDNYFPAKPILSPGSQIINKTLLSYKIFYNRLPSIGLFFELKLVNFFTKYIYYSSTITQSLSVRDIVFPFHYFW